MALQNKTSSVFRKYRRRKFHRCSVASKKLSRNMATLLVLSKHHEEESKIIKRNYSNHLRKEINERHPRIISHWMKEYLI